jgi:hypothetical protein
MEPVDDKTKKQCAPISRGGFYIHDSTKGYSHGCIEVESSIFKHLREINKLSNKKSVLMKVKYISGRPTNGGTKK